MLLEIELCIYLYFIGIFYQSIHPSTFDRAFPIRVTGALESKPADFSREASAPGHVVTKSQESWLD